MLPAAIAIAKNVNTSDSGTISLEELTRYFGAVNAKYNRDSDGTKE
jgi:hypothetical protein